MCKKANFLLFTYNAYTHMYMLSIRLSIKPPQIDIYKHGVQVLIPQCVCSSKFLIQHLKNFSTMEKIFFSVRFQGGWGQFGCVFFVGHLVYVDRWPVLFQWSRWMVFRLCQFFPHLLSILDWYLWTKLSCTPEWFCKQAPECRSLFWDLKINMHIKSYDRNDSVWCLSWIL